MGSVFGSICLISGTSIGAGVLALPQLAASVGLGWCFIITLFTWWVVYILGLYMADKYIQVGGGRSFTQVCQELGGRFAFTLSTFCFFALGFALIIAYLGAMQSLLGVQSQVLIPAISCVVLSLSVRWIDRLNRPIFLVTIGMFVSVIVALCCVPLKVPSLFEGRAQGAMLFIPVIFTSFGCQVLLGPLVDYFRCDRAKIRRAWFWGTIIPLVVYLLWIALVVCAIYMRGGDIWQTVSSGKSLPIGDMITGLGSVFSSHITQIFLKMFSFLAVLTSFVGVGFGVVEKIFLSFPPCWPWLVRRSFSSLILVLPAWIGVLSGSDIFIRALSWGGVINATKVIFVPLLIGKIMVLQHKGQVCGSGLGSWKYVLVPSMLWGALVVVCELLSS